MKEIDAREGTSLICYVGGRHTEIDRNDVVGFVDMLHNLQEAHQSIFFCTHPAGDVDACEKLIAL